MVLLEVRILPAPPRSHPLGEISRLLPNGPELAGSAVSVPVSAETDDGHRAILAALSLASEFGFPERRSSQVRVGHHLSWTFDAAKTNGGKIHTPRLERN